MRFQLWSGVAFLHADRFLGKRGNIKRQNRQQTICKAPINAGQVEYLDTPLGFFYQSIRGGELGSPGLAIVEAVGTTPEGNLIPAYRLHDSPTSSRPPTGWLFQLSAAYPWASKGYDVYLPLNPPRAKPIPIWRVDDRAGTPMFRLDPKKVAAIYVSDSRKP